MNDDKYILPVFPFPPSTNDAYFDRILYVSGKPIAKRVLGDKGREYKQAVSDILNHGGTTTKLRQFVKAHITVDVMIYAYKSNWLTKNGVPNRIAGDVDNRVKLLQDAIFNCIGVDDCAVFYSGVRKLYGEEAKVVVVFTATPEIVDSF